MSQKDTVVPRYTMGHIPRMTSVFVEASLHAWKNLGLDQEVKSYMETNFSPEEAYLLAICHLPWLKDEMEILKDFGSESKVQAMERVWNNDPPVLYPILQALHKKTDPKLPGILKSDAHKIAKMNWQQGEDYFRDLVDRVKVPEPEGYGGEDFCQSLNGWKWVRVGDQACRDHEGALMQHCGQGDRGDMYSLRDPKGKPHITVEMDLTSAPWSIYQMKGKQNMPPAKKLWPYAINLLEQMFEQNGQAMWYEHYEKDPEGFTDALVETGYVHDDSSPDQDGFMMGDDDIADDERAFMDDAPEGEDVCPDCNGVQPPGRTCPGCGRTGVGL